MTPTAFISKWRANARNERAAAQEHFLDLCALLDEPTPNSDPTGAAYAFEKGATKASGGEKCGPNHVRRSPDRRRTLASRPASRQREGRPRLGVGWTVGLGQNHEMLPCQGDALAGFALLDRVPTVSAVACKLPFVWHVNAHHQRLKQFINLQGRGVSTRYLPDYLGWSRAFCRPGFAP